MSVAHERRATAALVAQRADALRPLTRAGGMYWVRARHAAVSAVVVATTAAVERLLVVPPGLLREQVGGAASAAADGVLALSAVDGDAHDSDPLAAGDGSAHLVQRIVSSSSASSGVSPSTRMRHR